MRHLRPALLGLALLSAIAFFVGLALGLPALRLVAKPVPALALAVWVAAERPGAGARPTVAGLVASAGGDLLLERGAFLAGLLAFLIAHLAYIAGFLRRSRRPAPLRLLPFALWGGAVLVLLFPRAGGMALPLAVYVAAIVAMMWRAAACVGEEGRSPAPDRIGLAGAVLFGASDTLIGLDRFVAPLPGARIPILLLYWLGQLGIALAAAAAPRPAGPGYPAERR